MKNKDTLTIEEIYLLSIALAAAYIAGGYVADKVEEKTRYARAKRFGKKRREQVVQDGLTRMAHLKFKAEELTKAERREFEIEKRFLNIIKHY